MSCHFSMASTRLPPGFRFHPTDVELIMYYLKRKVMGKKFCFQAITEVNIYKFSPWDLPDKSYLKSRDREWFFFCPSERKYASGGRMNRATETGYWKTTGKDRSVQYNDKIVGMVKTLVFHQGHAPKGQRTDWVIYEYRMQDQLLSDAGVAQDSFVLCKLFHKNGLGPRIGAQYGAPFMEDEWEDDVSDCDRTFSVNHSLSVAVAATNIPEITSTSVLTGMGGPEVSSIWPLAEPGPSSAPSTGALAEPGPSSAPSTGLSDLEDDDDPLHLLSSFSDVAIPPDHVDSHEMLDHRDQENYIDNVACSNGNDIYSGLADLSDWQAFGEDALNLPLSYHFPESFLELDDLDRPLDSNRDAEMENMPSDNYNISHFSPSLDCSGSTQLPLLADGPTGVGIISNAPEVDGNGRSNANEVYLGFQQPERVHIGQSNSWIL